MRRSAARALLRHSNLSSSEIAKEAMKIAAEICIYTNNNVTLEEIEDAANITGETKKSKNKESE